MAEAERIELPRPIKVITVFKTDKHASLASLLDLSIQLSVFSNQTK
jgi:hypothetical protein